MCGIKMLYVSSMYLFRFFFLCFSLIGWGPSVSAVNGTLPRMDSRSYDVNLLIVFSFGSLKEIRMDIKFLFNFVFLFDFGNWKNWICDFAKLEKDFLAVLVETSGGRDLVIVVL